MSTLFHLCVSHLNVRAYCKLRAFVHFHTPSQSTQSHKLLSEHLQQSLGSFRVPFWTSAEKQQSTLIKILQPHTARCHVLTHMLLMMTSLFCDEEEKPPSTLSRMPTIFSHLLARALNDEGCKVQEDNSREAAWRKPVWHASLSSFKGLRLLKTESNGGGGGGGGVIPGGDLGVKRKQTPTPPRYKHKHFLLCLV